MKNWCVKEIFVLWVNIVYKLKNGIFSGVIVGMLRIEEKDRGKRI